MVRIEKYTSQSSTETMSLGFQLGKLLKKNSVVCFRGDLAAGKTTFIKGLVAGADCSSTTVNSPTFVYLNIYEGSTPVYHFDLYRLHDADEFLSMGFDEFLTANGISCIEWSERITELLPTDRIEVELQHISENVRHITIKNTYGNLF